jgi:hypothetical protein
VLPEWDAAFCEFEKATEEFNSIVHRIKQEDAHRLPERPPEE